MVKPVRTAPDYDKILPALATDLFVLRDTIRNLYAEVFNRINPENLGGVTRIIIEDGRVDFMTNDGRMAYDYDVDRETFNAEQAHARAEILALYHNQLAPLALHRLVQIIELNSDNDRD